MNDDNLGKALLMIVSFYFSIGLMKLSFTKTNISGKNINVGTNCNHQTKDNGRAAAVVNWKIRPGWVQGQKHRRRIT